MIITVTVTTRSGRTYTGEIQIPNESMARDQAIKQIMDGADILFRPGGAFQIEQDGVHTVINGAEIEAVGAAVSG